MKKSNCLVFILLLIIFRPLFAALAVTGSDPLPPQNNIMENLKFLQQIQQTQLIQDPTRPPQELLTPPPTVRAYNRNKLRVSGIFIRYRKRLAIINGRTLTEGEKIGDFTVTRIRLNEVELVGPNQVRLILLLNRNIKQRTG